MGHPITGLGSDLARWATQTEKYLTQLLLNPTTGRGSRINFYHAPLVDQGRSTTEERPPGLLGKDEGQNQCSPPNP